MRQLAIASSIAGLLSTAAFATAPSPLDASASAPPLVYTSPFASYRGFDDVEARSWREVNDTVRDVGGHVGAMSSSPRNPGGSASPGAGHHGKPPDARTKPAASTPPSGAAKP